MGSGKSTIGRRLAKAAAYGFIDLDELFEKTYKIGIQVFFKKYDENAFRIIEHELLKSTVSLDNLVVSTGGGTPCFFNNIEIIKKNGISVYLKMHIDSLVFRLLNSKKSRPQIKGLDEKGLLERVKNDMLFRENYYNKAHYSIKGENLELPEIIKLIRPHLKDGIEV